MFFRIKEGFHVQDEKTYKKGEIVETPLDLCAMFINKFERVYKEELAEAKAKAVMTAKKTPTPKTDPDPVDPNDVDDAPEPAEVIDVTDKFAAAAKKKGVTVTKGDEGYNIYDVDNTEEPMNDEPLLSANKVKQFIKNIELV